MTGVSQWMGSGTAEHADGRVAATRATKQALQGPDLRAVIVFSAHSYEADAVVGGVSDVVGDGVAVIGCTTGGEIADGRAHDASVTVMALGGSSLQATAAHVDDIGVDTADRSRELCLAASAEGGRHRAMVVLVDGYLDARLEFASGAYAALGATTQLIGGGAGDGFTREGARQFHGRSVMTNGAVALGLTSDAPFGVGLGFGYEAVGDPFIVTQVQGQWITTLDHQLALDAYLQRAADAEELPMSMHEFAMASFRHPLGLERGDSIDPVLLVDADQDRRWLRVLRPIPEGAAVRFLSTDSTRMGAAMLDAISDAGARLDGPASGYLVFDCALRWAACGREMTDGFLAAAVQQVAPTPLVGMASYCEIARVRGPSSFHNSSVAVLAMG